VKLPFRAYSGDEPYVFVSYAHADASLVYPEMVRLRQQGYNVWYDEGIRPGAEWREEVALALTESKLFLYYVTPSSVSSEYCQQELNLALTRERRILAVHLVDTELSAGVELSLSNKQAIIRSDLSEMAYANKLTEALQALMPVSSSTSEILGVMEEKSAYEQSIAALPFTNLSSDPENEHLCDGVTDELVTGLAKIEGLRVASQLSCFGLKGQHLEPRAIGAKLNVANVLTGNIQKSGERVRITATLCEVANGSVLWSERYTGMLEDVFDLQEDVANKVIDALKLELGAESDAPVIDSGTSSVVAYQSFVLGKHEMKKGNRAGFSKAHENFADAVSADPAFGRAYWFDIHTWQLERELRFTTLEEFLSGVSLAVEKMRLTGFEPPRPAIWIERILDSRLVPDQKSLAKEALAVIRDGDEDEEWHYHQFSQLSSCLQAAGLLNAAREFLDYYMTTTWHHEERWSGKIGHLDKWLICA
jgi:TolB-like protein